MSIYYAHVGRDGAVDFDKTLRKPVDIMMIAQHLDASQKFILDDLREIYPNDKVYCWGIPSGGTAAIKELKPGDYVFLLEYLQELPGLDSLNGPIPLLVKVTYYSPSLALGNLHNLSQALWGSVNFPQIFFVTPMPIKLDWIAFCNAVGYKPTYNPRGKMMKVIDNKIALAGGEEQVMKKLLVGCYDTAMSLFSTTQDKDDSYGLFDLVEEMIRIEKSSDSNEYPSPLLSQTRPLDEVLRKKRDSAFSILVRNAYDYKCAICRSSLASKDGKRFEVEAAHILPVEHNGPDDIRNGICLCRTHHWAFDEGLFTINDDFSISIHTDDASFFSYKGTSIGLPRDSKYKPHSIFLKAHREINI